MWLNNPTIWWPQLYKQLDVAYITFSTGEETNTNDLDEQRPGAVWVRGVMPIESEGARAKWIFNASSKRQKIAK